MTAGLAIYDTMQYVKPPVSTICMGQAASMGAVLLAAGRQGQALRPAQRPDHDPPALGRVRRARRPTSRSRPRRSLRLKARLNEILAKHTGQPIERIEKDTDRDYFMGAARPRSTASSTRSFAHKKAQEKKQQ